MHKNQTSKVLVGFVRKLFGQYCVGQGGPKSCEQKVQVANSLYLSWGSSDRRSASIKRPEGRLDKSN